MAGSDIVDDAATGSPLAATASPEPVPGHDYAANDTINGSPDVKSVSALLDELLIGDPAAAQLPAATVAPAESLSPLQRLLALCGQVRG